MTPEQKQRAVDLIDVTKTYRLDAEECAMQMAAMLQELVDAHETKPVARVTGYYAGYLSIATVDGRVLPTGTALYTAPPAPSVPVDPMENIALNEWLDKTEWVQKELNTFPASSLGMHRADVMRLEIERLREIDRLREMIAASPTPAEAPADVARYRWLLKQAWFQQAADRFDLPDGGLQKRFEKCMDDFIDAAMSEKGGA